MVGSAEECTGAELDELFYRLSPDITEFDPLVPGQVYTFSFADVNGDVCTDAKNHYLNGDNYSDAFNADFCKCALHVSKDVLRDFTCTINGATVQEVKMACGQRMCSGDNPEEGCFCDYDQIIDLVQPYGDETKSSNVALFCKGA